MTRYVLQPLVLPLAALALAAVLFALGCDQAYHSYPGHDAGDVDAGADARPDASPDAGAPPDGCGR